MTQPASSASTADSAPHETARDVLARHHPYDLLPEDALAGFAAAGEIRTHPEGSVLLRHGMPVLRVEILLSGAVDAFSAEGERVTRYAPGEAVGARAILREKPSSVRAVAIAPTRTLAVPASAFLALLAAHPAVDAFYDRLRSTAARRAAPREGPGESGLAAPLSDVMTAGPVCVSPATSVRDAAALMAERAISCVLVGDEAGRLVGLLTTGDLTSRIVARGRSADTAVAEVMTPDPVTLAPDALVYDAMVLMSERGFGHLPIARGGRPEGILTRTNLVRRQTISAMYMLADIAKAADVQALAGVVAKLPELLVQLVGSGMPPHRVGHAITGVADAVTRRLLALAQGRLGPAPVPWLWLACGSQGRREQTGVSDQDNCLILDDAYDETRDGAYFAELARIVCDGLDACGYYYCPGEMMATSPRWRQPLAVWRSYFAGWISRPDPMAQMLASVMFDLRPIAGEAGLFEGLQAETLAAARKNSIFRAHMIANSLKHTPPLGLFRGFALIRSGEHKDAVDLKHSGVVPIVDLARVYALDGAIAAVNTRERLLAARGAGTLSESGAADLIDAYDLVCETRLAHQAAQVRAGARPDNFLKPSSLSALQRNHLKDAFGVVKGLQAALAHGRSAA
ncbi:putative nucleotidyltransferase substrate binding domain-containing protein [Salinarimonas sp. NSM]|uniref:putative nucleotidyltransferase substrate binding domain-containing protein n=1 Tax=Salinarimonas sp. NSM TaxID=3458003 RepID=UPI004035C6EC